MILRSSSSVLAFQLATPLNPGDLLYAPDLDPRSSDPPKILSISESPRFYKSIICPWVKKNLCPVSRLYIPLLDFLQTNRPLSDLSHVTSFHFLRIWKFISIQSSIPPLIWFDYELSISIYKNYIYLRDCLVGLLAWYCREVVLDQSSKSCNPSGSRQSKESLCSVSMISFPPAK